MISQDKKLTTYLNPYSYMILRENGLLDEVISRFNVEYDGTSILAAHNMLSSVKKIRRSFDDTSNAPEVFSWAAEHSMKVGIIGSSHDTIKKAEFLINKKYGPIIVWSHCGYFSAEEEIRITKDISICDVVICSMGTPKQEELLLKLQASGWSGRGYTCGGYFDQLVISNGQSYYPEILNSLNLRWAYRIYKEPKRLWRRYLLDYPKGLLFFFLDSLIERAR